MRSTIFAAAVLAMSTGVLAAQTVESRTEAQARMDAAMQTAISAGVPTSLLESKIAEGRAKGVAEARIAAAVEQRAQVLARVQAALQTRGAQHAERSGPPAQSRGQDARVKAVTAGELTAAADAFEKGVDLDALARISAEAGPQRAAALTVLADLVAQGRTPEHALVTVQAALSRGGNALAGLSAGGTGASASANAAASAGTSAAASGASVGAGARAGAGADVRIPRLGGGGY